MAGQGKALPGDGNLLPSYAARGERWHESNAQTEEEKIESNAQTEENDLKLALKQKDKYVKSMLDENKKHVEVMLQEKEKYVEVMLLEKETYVKVMLWEREKYLKLMLEVKDKQLDKLEQYTESMLKEKDIRIHNMEKEVLIAKGEPTCRGILEWAANKVAKENGYSLWLCKPVLYNLTKIYDANQTRKSHPVTNLLICSWENHMPEGRKKNEMIGEFCASLYDEL